MDSGQTTDFLLQHLAAVVGKRSDQVLQEQLGIGLAQYRVLAMLEQFPQATQRQLANHLGQTEAGVSRQMKLLAERAILIVQTGERSKREHTVLLTAKGFRLMQAAHEILGQYLTPTYDKLTAKEQKQLQSLLDKLHDHLCRESKRMACDRPFDPWLANMS